MGGAGDAVIGGRQVVRIIRKGRVPPVIKGRARWDRGVITEILVGILDLQPGMAVRRPCSEGKTIDIPGLKVGGGGPCRLFGTIGGGGEGGRRRDKIVIHDQSVAQIGDAVGTLGRQGKAGPRRDDRQVRARRGG